MCNPTLRSAAIWLMAVVAGAALLTACQTLRPSSGEDDDFDYRTIAYIRGRTQIWTVGSEKLTHINYAFAHVNDSGEVYLRDEDSPGHLAQIQALKAKNPDLKILVSVGGWGADGFSDAALNDSTRERFSRSAVELVKKYGLDGFDVDWEYPGQPGPGIKFREEDKHNFTLMLKSPPRASRCPQRRTRPNRRRPLSPYYSQRDERAVLRSHRDGCAASLSRFRECDDVRHVRQLVEHDRSPHRTV